VARRQLSKVTNFERLVSENRHLAGGPRGRPQTRSSLKRTQRDLNHRFRRNSNQLPATRTLFELGTENAVLDSRVV